MVALTQIHLIMPFSRHELKETLIEAYRPMGVIWHPIVFIDEVTDFGEPWIVPCVIPEMSFDCTVMMPGCYKRNYWIQNVPVIDDDYYVTVDDDDMYEADVFNAVKEMNDDIVIISMKRGHDVPAGVSSIRRYPTTTLIAKPSMIQLGGVSAQQLFVKGRIFGKHLFNEESHCWDGEIAIHHSASNEQIAFRPDLYALFNLYEPGRWAGMEWICLHSRAA